MNYRYEVALGKMLDEKRITGASLGPYLRNVDVQWGRINTSDLPSMDFVGNDLERYALLPGDLLVCEGGEVGRAAVWRGEVSPCFYQKALHRLRPRRLDADDARYLFYVLRAAADVGLFVGAAGRSTIAHLTAEALRRYRFPFPSAAEQRAIAAFLDRECGKIDALVAEQERLIALLKEKRQAVISHAVTKGLDPDAPLKDSGIEWLGKVPVHWEVRRIKDVARLESGHTPSRQFPEYWDGGDIEWVSLNDSKHLAANDFISETAFKITSAGLANSSARLLPPGSVVFTRDATIGLAAITMREMAVSQHLIAWCPSPAIGSLFLLRVFNAMKAFLDGYTAGATIKTIGMPEVRKLLTPVPPLEEQDSIVAFIAAETAKLDMLTTEVDRAISLLKERRAALISAAVTGKIDVRGLVAPVEAKAA